MIGGTRRPPDFFVAGHPKSGTTALYEALRRHPEIYMPARKEPNYFAWDNPLPEGTNGRRWRSVDQTPPRPERIDDYLALFADAAPEQKTGEASTSYLWWPTAPGNIAAVNPAARIVAIFREPAAFLRALHEQLIANGHEVEADFRKAVSLDEDRRQGRQIPDRSIWPKALIYSDRVRYVEQLRRFERAFPREQLLVLIYDDYRSDNAGSARRVLEFLGVDPDVALTFAEANPAIHVRSPRRRELLRRVNKSQSLAGRAARSAGRVVAPSSDVRLRLAKRFLFDAPKPPDEEFMAVLRRRFKDEVVALSEYLDRDLVRLWGYEDVD